MKVFAVWIAHPLVDVSANCLACIASGSIFQILAFLRSKRVFCRSPVIERPDPMAKQRPPTSGKSIRLSLHGPLSLFRIGYPWDNEVALVSTRPCLVGHCLSTRSNPVPG